MAERLSRPDKLSTPVDSADRMCSYEHMCGRFTLQTPAETLQRLFAFEAPAPSWDPSLTERPRYNIAPTQPILVIRHGPEGRLGQWAKWGLTAAKKRLAINARSETVFDRPAFRSAVRSRRAIVPASGFLEWHVDGKKRRPRHIVPVDGQVLAFAAVLAEPKGHPPAAAILTTRASADVSPVHDRMPVCLDAEGLALWLDPGVESPYALEGLFRPLPDGALRLVPVSERVNKVAHDDPECLLPVIETEAPKPSPPPRRRGRSGVDPRQLGFGF